METNCRLVVVSFYRNMELIFDRPTLRASFATQNDNFKLISHRIQCGGDGVELRRVAQIKDARHFLGLAAHYACHICRPHAVLKLGIQERDLCGDGKRQRDKALRWPRPARRPGGLAVPGPGREFRSGRLCSACWGSRSGSMPAGRLSSGASSLCRSSMPTRGLGAYGSTGSRRVVSVARALSNWCQAASHDLHASHRQRGGLALTQSECFMGVMRWQPSLHPRSQELFATALSARYQASMASTSGTDTSPSARPLLTRCATMQRRWRSGL